MPELEFLVLLALTGNWLTSMKDVLEIQELQGRFLLLMLERYDHLMKQHAILLSALARKKAVSSEDLEFASKEWDATLEVEKALDPKFKAFAEESKVLLDGLKVRVEETRRLRAQFTTWLQNYNTPELMKAMEHLINLLDSLKQQSREEPKAE